MEDIKLTGHHILTFLEALLEPSRRNVYLSAMYDDKHREGVSRLLNNISNSTQVLIVPGLDSICESCQYSNDSKKRKLMGCEYESDCYLPGIENGRLYPLNTLKKLYPKWKKRFNLRH